jgi:DNA polymerase III epsilon subunit-like protein
MIVVDIEASGTEPYKHSIVSIGALDFTNPEKQFYAECRIWDGAHIMDEALAVNGFTKEQIMDPPKKTEGEIVTEFFKWLKDSPDHTTAGQNPSFDRDFLRLAAERAHIDYPLAYRTVDLHSVCYLHMIEHGLIPPLKNKRSDLNSGKIMGYVGIPEEPKPHNALMGAKVAGEALSRLLYRKNLLPDFAQFEIPKF